MAIAENGGQALRTLAQNCHDLHEHACPHLILLDMAMPVLNGRGFPQAYVQLPLT